MKKIVAVSFAVCLSVSTVVNAQPNGNASNQSLSQTISKQTKNNGENPYKTQNERLQEECANNHFHSCTALAVNLFSSGNSHTGRIQYLLERACSPKSNQYDPEACGLLGTEYLPNVADNIGLYRPDPNQAVFYLERGCNSNALHRDNFCLNLKTAYREQAKIPYRNQGRWLGN